MKILFTGGETGGHFYPIIAVAEAFNDLTREQKILEPKLYFAAPDPYDRELLNANNITYVPTAAGKMRHYFSILNFFGLFKTAWGVIRSIVRIFFLYPDVVFGAGGAPSRVNRWAGKFAKKIAISFPEAAEFFPKEKVALTGNPVRKAAMLPAREGTHEFLKLKHELPILLVVGGSQGSQTINDAILDALPKLLQKYQIVHQTGEKNIKEVEGRAKIVMGDSPLIERYKTFGYLNDLATRMAAGAAALVVARAGAGTIFEVATWGLPSILIPIPEGISHDQTKNAFAYARAGAATVIEQNNLTPGVLVSEIERILDNKDLARSMGEKARGFARPDAGKAIATALMEIALSHEA